MFGIFKRDTALSGAGASGLHDKPVIEWCPTATTRAARALMDQLKDTGYFLGALTIRHGFHMRTQPDGLETGTHAGLMARVDVSETQVLLSFGGVDPARVALMSLGAAIAESAGTSVSWDTHRDGNTQILSTEVVFDGAGVLRVTCKTDLVDPLRTGTRLEGARIAIQLSRVN